MTRRISLEPHLTIDEPDLQLTTEHLDAEADEVAIRNTWRGTHDAAFQGIPPTVKLVTFMGTDSFRFVGRGWQDR